jgi:hypothetical protein
MPLAEVTVRAGQFEAQSPAHELVPSVSLSNVYSVIPFGPVK